MRGRVLPRRVKTTLHQPALGFTIKGGLSGRGA
jgi:hypothetical protein